MEVVLISLAGVLFLAACTALLLYNRLVRLRNRVDNAWHQIDVQLNRRYDLVPALAEVVKGYTSHEKETLDSAARARTRAINAATVGEQGPAEDSVTGAIGSVLALAEKYPDLKANTEFLKFQAQLATAENRIAGSRKYYNGAVMYYNNARETFPGNTVARVFSSSFTDRDYFDIKDPADRQAPEVSTVP